ncbi:unnamed protein product [Larinioides sclopetarius]|uniref:Ribosomal protein L32 n=1 Tax=Larinioides sclopetarius TaxID=280406 RepID=A0AAV1ZFN7_9ARAC
MICIFIGATSKFRSHREFRSIGMYKKFNYKFGFYHVTSQKKYVGRK